MKAELQAELLRRYPKFFRKPGMRLVDPEFASDAATSLMDDTAPFDVHGIECGDGWFALIDGLSSACEKEIDVLIGQNVAKESWPRVAQIKEKMGGLRFYVNGPLSDPLWAQIRQAENIESLRTCESCGAPGKRRDGRWRHTYCDPCEVEHGRS